jgi:hypothetical protein
MFINTFFIDKGRGWLYLSGNHGYFLKDVKSILYRVLQHLIYRRLSQKRKTMIRRKCSLGSLYVIIIICLIFIFMGCSKQPVQTLSVDKAQAAEKETIAQKQSAAETVTVKSAVDLPSPGDQAAADKKIKPATPADQTRTLPATYVVKEGDSLWWIAKYRDVYNDPYLWPIVYDANKNVMKDPNKIYPGMKLQIPRAGYKPADIRNARKTAGARKPYNTPARAVPPAD